jgi:hypothetical protein
MSRPNPESTTGTHVATEQWNGGGTTYIRTFNASHRAFGGTVTPNFYSTPKYLYPMNEYSLKHTKRWTNLMYRSQIYKWDPSVFNIRRDTYHALFGVDFPDRSYNISHSPQALQQAIQKIAARVKDQKINVAQAFAEHQKTIDLVANTAVKIAAAISAVKKGKFGAAQKALTGVRRGSPKGSTVSQNWLELQYGWKPLLMDVHGAVAHLAQNPKPPSFVVSAQASASDSKQVLKDLVSGSGGSWFLTSREQQYSSVARLALRFQVKDHAVKELNQLGITNPAAVAWELLPWTFVVDWFLPIGDYLNTLGYDQGLEFVTGYQVQFTRNNWIISIPGVAFSDTNYNYTYGSADLVTSSNVLHDRTRLYAPPEPSFPAFKNPLSLGHAANALALLRMSIR